MATADDARFIERAYRLASSTSHDPRTHNGAVIVYDGRVIASSANRFPVGVTRTGERLERPRKYAFMEHAERNAIFEAARLGRSTAGATMYCPWAACAECARAIIQSGIIRLVGHYHAAQSTRGDWSQSLADAKEMLEEAGVELAFVEGMIGIPFLFGGEVVNV